MEVLLSGSCMQTNVQSTQEIVELILDSNRNALLALDLKVGIRIPLRRTFCKLKRYIFQVSIWTMGIGVGTLVAGLFGMNVRRILAIVDLLAY